LLAFFALTVSSQKVKITHIVTKGDFGGAQSIVHELVSSQLNCGHEVSLITGRTGQISDSLKTLGAHIVCVPELVHSFSLHQDRKAYTAIVSSIASLQPEILHCHSSKAGHIGRTAARATHTPSLYTAHGWPFQPGARLAQRIQSFPGEIHAARRGGHVVCVSQHDLDLAMRCHVAPKSRLHLIPNGISDLPQQLRNVPNDRSAPRSDARALSLVMVARFAKPKRQDILLRALVNVPQARLTLVGDGPLQRDTESLVDLLDLNDRVRILPHDTNIASELNLHDTFVLLSDYEGLPVSILEGLRAGLPIIANDLSAMREAVGSAGLLVPKSPEGAAFAIHQLLIDKQLCSNLAIAARKRFVEKFSSATMCDSYQDLYAQICHASIGN
jgi:glycosyltransferase involved in cell wall biosynthesis